MPATKKRIKCSPKRKRQSLPIMKLARACGPPCQSHSAPVQKITIFRVTSGALGYTMQVEEDERFLMSRDEFGE